MPMYVHIAWGLTFESAIVSDSWKAVESFSEYRNR